MTRKIGRFAMVLGFAGCFLSAASAFAQTDLPDGGSVTPMSGTVSSILGTGYSVLDTQSFLSQGNGAFSYDLTAEVVQTGGGTLDFLYQVTNLGGSTVPIDGLNVTDYSTYSSAVANITDGSTLGNGFSDGTVASTSSSRPAPYSTVLFGFGATGSNDIGAGSTSLVEVVATNATTYDLRGTATATTLSNGGGSFAVNGVLEPTAAVPEPGSLVLGGLAMISVAGAYGFRRMRGR